MDTEKLFKAIQIVIKEEVKAQMSSIKEEIRKQVLSEVKTALTKTTQKTTNLKSVVNESEDAFELANRILSTSRKETKQYSKNPLLNTILNETKVRPNFSKDDGSWGTITPDMVGYGEPAQGKQESISTGNDILDKAIARSSAVLKASKEKKG